MSTVNDESVEAFDINVSGGAFDGCDGHPNLAKNQAMAESLAQKLKSVLGW